MKFFNTLTIFFSIGILAPTILFAQDDLLAQLPSDKEAKTFSIAGFKSTRVINFHSYEVLGKRSLDFKISHRFGDLSSGIDGFYGIDGPASIRLGLEYSHDGRLMVGFGRTSYEKMLDGFIKYRLVRQTENGSMPFNITLMSSMFVKTGKDPEESITGINKYKYFSNRISYCHQLIIGRKFSPKFSAQIAPSIVHFNMAERFTDNNDSYFLTGAIRYKFTKRIALTAEYGARMRTYTQQKVYNSMGIGIDIETGGHVFQMFVTNSFGIVESQFLPFTTTSWSDNGVRIGFNVSRVFGL